MIGVGDELLLGRTVDANAAWLGRELADLGLPVRRHIAVGDGIGEIQEALDWGLATGDIVLFTGGLGPTRDDRTREAVAGALRRPLHRDESLAAILLERSRLRGRPDPSEDYFRQADVPEGGRALENRHGSAPGLILEAEGKVVILLPGVPAEMRGIFADGVAPFLRERFQATRRRVHFRVLHTFGVPELVLSDLIVPVLPPEDAPVEVAFLPRLGGVDLRLTVPGTLAPTEAAAWLDRVEGQIAPLIEPHRFLATSSDLAEAVAESLIRSDRSVAVAESCTGGLLGKRLTDRGGASGYFLGGIIAYSDDVKRRELGIDPELLTRVGAVSEEVARAMAVGVAKRFAADVGMAITGIAGPGGGSAQKPVGTVWYAVSIEGEVEARVQRFPGDRDGIRERSAEAALALLFTKLRQLEDSNPSE